MTKLVAVVVLLTLCISCMQDERAQFDPYTGDLSSIEGTDLKSDITVSLIDQKGNEVKDLSALQPNSQYKIRLNADVEFVRIKKGDGFQVLKSPSMLSHEFGSAEYTILTNNDLADQIYLNVVPIRKGADGVQREYSQIFLLPAL